MGNRDVKEAEIQELRERLQGADLVVVTHYRGLTVKQMQQLRRSLRQTGAQFKISKNTLLGLAAEREGQPGLVPLLEGPTALAFASGEIAGTAKALSEFAKTAEALVIQGGLMNGQPISAADVQALASLPSREALLAKMLGSLQSPAVGLVTALNGVARNLVYVLQARADQMRQSEGASA